MPINVVYVTLSTITSHIFLIALIALSIFLLMKNIVAVPALCRCYTCHTTRCITRKLKLNTYFSVLIVIKD